MIGSAGRGREEGGGMASEGESGPSPEVIEIDLIDDVPDGLNSSEVILSRYPPSGWYLPSTGRFAVHHGHRALGYDTLQRVFSFSHRSIANLSIWWRHRGLLSRLIRRILISPEWKQIKGEKLTVKPVKEFSGPRGKFQVGPKPSRGVKSLAEFPRLSGFARSCLSPPRLSLFPVNVLPYLPTSSPKFHPFLNSPAVIFHLFRLNLI